MPFIEEEELKNLRKNLEKEKSSNMKLLDYNAKKTKEAEKQKKGKIRMMIFVIVFAVGFYSIVSVLFFKPSLLINMLSSEAELKATEMANQAFELGKDLAEKEIEIENLKATNEELKVQNMLAQQKQQSQAIDTIRVEVMPSYYKQQRDFQDFLKGKKIYTVQLGIFKKLNIMPLSKGFVNFRGYKKDDYFVYSIGNFVNKNEAEAFRVQLHKMGVRNSFITDYTLK